MIVEAMDLAICGLFLVDFAVRFRRAPNRLSFLAWSWPDLVGSIPFVGVLRVARLARIIRVLRLVRSGRVILSVANRQRARSAFQAVFLMNVALVVLASVAVFHVEHGENPQFRTLSDVLWWAVVAVTTLGFEGVLPVTPEGKVFAILLVVGGVLLFGTFVGMVADYFVEEEEVLDELRAVHARLDRIEKLLSDGRPSDATPGRGASPGERAP